MALGLKDKKEDRPVTVGRRIKLFLLVHWRGLVIIIVPLAALGVLFPWPPQPWQWAAFTLLIMAFWWVTECIPLSVTSFLPVIIFPLSGIMDTRTTCECYCNSAVLLFLGSLMFAVAVEVSGLHVRLALCAIRCLGYSHYRLLLALSSITMFVSMWITNTAATTMMVPIVFALLRTLEKQKILTIFELNSEGREQATDMTTCYFCAVAFSASIGGIGTLVGTGTNLTFKGLFQDNYPTAPEYLSFPLFSAFSIPLMLTLEASMYFILVTMYFGFLRPNSRAARTSKMPDHAIKAAKAEIDSMYRALGNISYHEYMVILLFGGAMISLFCRSPQVFPGWGDYLVDFFNIEEKKFITDTVLAFFVNFLMYLLPASLTLFKNCSAKKHGDLPKGRVKSVLDWKESCKTIPFSFMFLYGGGFALSTAAKEKYTNLNGKIGDVLSGVKILPDSVILLILTVFSIFLTNFASNVAVANIIVPIAITLAKMINKNPLKYCIITGYTASFCFMLPVGTPPNLIVKSVAKVTTAKMILAGLGPTIVTVFWTWLFTMFYSPVIWPDINTLPEWTKKRPQ